MGKAIVSLMSILLLFSVSGFADNYQMASGYHVGQLDVSVFGDNGGLVSEIAKLYMAAGAKRTEYTKCPACPWASIEFANDNSQAIIVNEQKPSGPDAPPGGPSSMYQWNFSLTLADAIQVNTMGPGLGFNGPVAKALYTSLAKSKAPVVGWSANSKGQPTTPIYAIKGPKYSIYCEEQTKFSTASCYLRLH